MKHIILTFTVEYKTFRRPYATLHLDQGCGLVAIYCYTPQRRWFVGKISFFNKKKKCSQQNKTSKCSFVPTNCAENFCSWRPKKMLTWVWPQALQSESLRGGTERIYLLVINWVVLSSDGVSWLLVQHDINGFLQIFRWKICREMFERNDFSVTLCQGISGKKIKCCHQNVKKRQMRMSERLVLNTMTWPNIT